MNETLITEFTVPIQNTQPEYVIKTTHYFGITEILIVAGLFIFLAYLYVMVNKNKEKYEKWINPNGHEINLYKVIRRVFWAYVLTVIILGGITTLMAPR